MEPGHGARRTARVSEKRGGRRYQRCPPLDTVTCVRSPPCPRQAVAPDTKSGRLSPDHDSQSDDAPPRRAHWSDNLAAKIRGTPPWVLFAWLAATAVVYAYAGKLILAVAAIVLLVRGWWWLNGRFPQMMFCINAFLTGFARGLLSGRRRRW